jgi:type I restriction enzyme S subunit
VDQYVYRVDPGAADTEFIAWFMRSPVYLDRAPIETTPGQLPRIRLEEVASVAIELPPLDEQRQIVAALDHQFEIMERARSAAEAQLDAAEALPASSLRLIFQAPEAEHWPRVKLGELLSTPLKTGISGPADNQSDKRCLTLSAVRNGELDLTASKPVHVSDSAARWSAPQNLVQS